MTDLISRKAAIEYLMTNMGWHDEDGYTVDDADEKRAVITDLVNGIPAVDAAPIKPLSVWLAGYAVPPKYTVETNPVDSAKARAEGWEKHIRNLIECGLMEEE